MQQRFEIYTDIFVKHNLNLHCVNVIVIFFIFRIIETIRSLLMEPVVYTFSNIITNDM